MRIALSYIVATGVRIVYIKIIYVWSQSFKTHLFLVFIIYQQQPSQSHVLMNSADENFSIKPSLFLSPNMPQKRANVHATNC